MRAEAKSQEEPTRQRLSQVALSKIGGVADPATSQQPVHDTGWRLVMIRFLFRYVYRLCKNSFQYSAPFAHVPTTSWS